MYRLKVLIIEDDRDIRASIHCALEIEGYETLAVGNGREGLDALEHGFQADLIVLDLMMPVMSGQEFLSERSQNASLSGIPVVVVSAAREGDRTIDAFAVSQYLRKPFSLSDLSSSVKRFARVPGGLAVHDPA